MVGGYDNMFLMNCCRNLLFDKVNGKLNSGGRDKL